MDRPNRKDYYASSQIEYDFQVNRYYSDLEKYVDYLEQQQVN